MCVVVLCFEKNNHRLQKVNKEFSILNRQAFYSKILCVDQIKSSWYIFTDKKDQNLSQLFSSNLCKRFKIIFAKYLKGETVYIIPIEADGQRSICKHLQSEISHESIF